jgi:hypothetical protein
MSRSTTEISTTPGPAAVIPQIGWRGPWQQVAEAAQALRDRRVDGKAVLDLLP